jgi:hypothetical protein
VGGAEGVAARRSAFTLRGRGESSAGCEGHAVQAVHTGAGGPRGLRWPFAPREAPIHGLRVAGEWGGRCTGTIRGPGGAVVRPPGSGRLARSDRCILKLVSTPLLPPHLTGLRCVRLCAVHACGNSSAMSRAGSERAAALAHSGLAALVSVPRRPVARIQRPYFLHPQYRKLTAKVSTNGHFRTGRSGGVWLPELVAAARPGAQSAGVGAGGCVASMTRAPVTASRSATRRRRFTPRCPPLR